MRHPAEYFFKAQLISTPSITDGDLLQRASDWSFFPPLAGEQKDYVTHLRASLSGTDAPPPGFNPHDRLHRPSIRYLRQQKVYEYFWPDSAMQEAWDILRQPDRRMVIEQMLMARIDPNIGVKQINMKKGWKLTIPGILAYKHYFWNVDLLTFDEWGRFLYGRSMLYERHIDLQMAQPNLALHLIHVNQQIESKDMIQEVQRHAYFLFMELANKPGTDPAKTKGMAVMGKLVLEAHEALSTSDMALKDVLKNFEKFRMERPMAIPPPMKELAPKGNFSNSGIDAEKVTEPSKH
jgi:hypothetical protein